MSRLIPFSPISVYDSTLDLKQLFYITEVESVFCAARIQSLRKTEIFFSLGLKEKYTANTNLYVKQADSIAATGSCISLEVLLRDYFGSRHAVKIEIQNM
jgi:hypothetical protein